MPEKPKPNDEFPEAVQGMFTTAFVSLSLFFVEKISKVSSTDVLDFSSEDQCLIGIICIKFNFSSVIKLLDCFEIFYTWLSNRLNVYWYLTCGFLSQLREKYLSLEWFYDHVYKEEKENLVKFLDDSDCFENLQRLCRLQDFFIILCWNLVERETFLEKPFSNLKWFRQFYVLKGKALKFLNGAREKNIPNNTESALEEMLEKKISCNGSTAATTLINLNSNINKSNCNESTSNSSNNSGNVSNSNNKGTCSTNSENVLASGVSKPFDGMAIKTEDNAIKNICKTEIESEKVDPLSVTSANVPSVSSVCDSKSNVTTSSPLQQSSTSTTPVSGASVNGSGVEKTNLSTSPGNALSIREPKNEKCVPQPAIPFTENPSEIIGGNKDNHPANNRNGTPIPCTGAIKSEGIPCGGINLGPQCGGGSVLPCPPIHGPAGIGGPPVTVPTCTSIQPLPSNMLNKSSSSIESQYMQQQSQIFVFSTGLANQAAEAVLSEHYPSIIAFHCAQPGTVRFLEKHPLKVQQFHRHSSAMWLNNLAQMKQGNRQMKMGAMNPMHGPFMNQQFPGNSCGQCHSPCNHMGNHPPHMGGVGPRGPIHPGNCGGNQDFPFSPRNSWPHGMNGASVNCGPRFPGPQGNRPMFPHGIGPHCPDNIRPAGDYLGGDNMGPCSMLDSNKLNSVKVPDENLTPEQRQHRKEQLVILRNLGQLLLPDLHSPSGNDPNNMNQLSSNQQMHATHCQGDMCNHGGVTHPHMNDMEGGRHPQTMGINHFVPQKDHMGNSNDQGDWQRMNQFYDDRNKGHNMGNMPQSPHPQNHHSQLSHLPITPQSGVKQQPSLSSPSPTVGASPNSTIRVQGPPPPYHQGSRCPVPSPHPASPSTISLSSPHVTTGLASPADPRSFPHPPSSNRLAHPSPGGGSLHSTPLNSPKPVNSSSCGSSGALHVPKTSTTPIPISTPTSIQPSLPSSPGAAVSTTAGGSRKAPLTPGSASQSGELEFGTISQPLTPSSDPAMFGSNRSLHLCGQSPRATPKPADILAGAVGQNCPGKEPSLMPVPSPQQIQYLNAFEGQELTIQKQPNTSLRETELISQSVPSGEESMNRNCPPFVGNESPRNAFTNVTGSCNTTFCSCGDVSHPRFPHLNNEMAGRMYPVHQHPNMPGVEGLQRFRGNVPPNLLNQVPGPMLRCGMPGPNFDGNHRYRGPISNAQNDMVNPRFPGSMTMGMRPDGMMYRPPFGQGNANMEHMHQRQYLSPVPSVYDQNLPGSHPGLPHNMHPNVTNLQKSNMPFDHGKTTSPLNTHMTGDDSSSNMSIPCGSQRLSHFDPIASMTAMSDSTIGSPGINNRNPNPGAPNTLMGNNPTGCHPNMPVNFNSNMQTMQCVNQSNGHHNMMHGPPQGLPFAPGQNGQTISLTPQTVNNTGTFVNATMSIQQQLNIQNVTTSNYNNVPSASPTPSMMQMQQQLPGPSPGLTGIAGGNTVSSSASTNQPIMHSGVAPKSMCGSRSNSAGLPQQFPGSPLNAPPKRGSSPLPQNNTGMVPRNPGAVGSPGYMSPNVHVKANAPNTIQYLPARPQNCTSISNRPPSLDFLQRYASPLTNLDSKVPTHNLQYFPNANVNNGAGGMHLPPVGDNGLVARSHDLENQARSMGQLNRCNMPFASGPHNPNMSGQHLLPNSPMVNDSGEFRTTGGGPLMTAGPAMNVGPMGSPLGMFHGNKHLPLSPSGMAPDTTQPLPSSMGQSLNYKQSPFYGPTTADPNYAVQFHNFQQQLYATNTRGNQGNSQNVTTSPSFFNIK